MTSEEIKAEYTSSLADLTFNSKPLINVLTMLAEENSQNASDIVEAIETHLSKVQIDVKLPVLYLIDCIVKNVGDTYKNLFSQNIVSTFCSVFKVVDEKTRAEMFKLRQTWNDVFPQQKLYAIDVQISMLDPAWPVTAKPPPKSIHLNPRFLQNSTNTNSTNESTPITPNAANVDPETLKMQQKLIQKQKELIELEQKKLELELLQTQVKLQEQFKHLPAGGGPPRSTNILLKPEVAKQLVTPQTTQSSVLKRPMGIGAASIMNQRLQQNNSGNNPPRITPVNSALVSAARPIRDPRLLRQQQQKQNSNNSNVQLGSKTSVLESNNKVVSNKTGLRDSNRNEPRSNSNKDDIPSQKLDTTNKSKSTFSKSRLFDSSSSHKSSKSSRGSSSKSNLEYDAKSNSIKASSSSSSLDSPVKNKSDKNSSDKSSKSPVRHKKKDSTKQDDSKKGSPKDKRDKSHKSDSSLMPTFKEVKSSVKNRTYVRRNRSPSVSPEPPVDEDLRTLPPPEKQARLQNNIPTDEQSNNVGLNQTMDVDLRQLPAVIGKKRPSTESPETVKAPKKKKMFDVLFGNEDTDLRQLPVVNNDRPPTPPPPIISSSDTKRDSAESPKKNNLDAVRAKLANATIMSKSFNKKKLHAASTDDQDLRVHQVSSTTDISDKIIISPADEQSIKSGNMTSEQEKQLLNKILKQLEENKLREARKRDHEESIGNISTQTISDDELEDNDNFRDDTRKSNNDKDDRLISNQFHEDPYNRGFPRRGPTWRGRRRQWEPLHGPSSRSSIRPWLHPPGNPWRNMGPNNFVRPSHPDFIPHHDFVPPPITVDDDRNSPEVPSDLIVESVNDDDIKTINIDGVPRDIRYYDDTTVVFMSWDDPKEISFQDGCRRITFDEKETYMVSFNEPYKDVLINGSPHKVKLGAPSREIFIDDNSYECYFGGPGITIELNGKTTLVKLDGPPPQVKIGTVKRIDLVAGKINLIINAKTIVPVFLDAKVQKFVIEGETHTLKFVDSLKSVLINDILFNVEFGGLPKPITVHDKKHFIRFSVLPKGIKPGHVKIKDMESSDSSLSPRNDENSQDSNFGSPMDTNEPALPALGKRRKVPKADDSPDRNSNSPHFFLNQLQQHNMSNLDVLSNVMAASVTPSTPSSGGYQVENMSQNTDSQSSNPLDAALQSKATNLLPASVNINELFQKLVASGIVTSTTKQNSPQRNLPPPPPIPPPILLGNLPPPPGMLPEPPKTVRRNPLEHMRPVTFAKPETLKIRQGSLYIALYAGMQCSSCGMRFPPEQSMHYSQHLDWHFRQNRKGKKNIRVAASRRWYYSLSDWKNYEEIEDLEEREKNYFDQQMTQTEGQGEDAEDEVEIPSVPADPDKTDGSCEVCEDKFDQFFNEEKEEWHLRNAIRVEDKTYHPVCYEDYLASLQDQTLESSNIETPTEETKPPEDSLIPGFEIILDDDEEEEYEKLSEPDEVIIEESDESNKPSEENTPQVEEPEDDGEDDDVILNEVAPERIIVDDDDDDYNEEDSNLDTRIKVKQEKEIDDGFVDVGEGLVSLQNGGQIKIKSEPVDPDESMNISYQDEEPSTTEEKEDTQADAEPTTELTEDKEEQPQPAKSVVIDTPHIGLISTIDGNVELDSGIPTTTAATSGKIKINISKPLPALNVPKEPKEVTNDSDNVCETLVDPSQPLPPGEEAVQLNLKPALKSVELKKLPPVNKGTELSGLCSIM